MIARRLFVFLAKGSLGLLMIACTPKTPAEVDQGDASFDASGVHLAEAGPATMQLPAILDGGAGGSLADAAGVDLPEAAPPPAPVPLQPCRLLGVGDSSSMDLSPDGKLAAFGSAEGGVTLMSISPFVALRTITAHARQVSAVSFSADSATVASGDKNGNISLWNVADGRALWNAAPVPGIVTALGFSASGTLWALTDGGLIAVDDATGTHMGPAPGTAAAALALSLDGQSIALGDNAGGFRLLRASDLSVALAVPAANAGGVTAIRISSSGNKLVTGGKDGTIALWDFQGNLLTRISRPGKPITSVDLAADGSVLLGATSGYAGVFNSDGTVIGEYRPFPSSARLSTDAKGVISMEGGGRVEKTPLDGSDRANEAVWDDTTVSIALSPDGRYFANSVYDNVRLWDTETGALVRILDTTPPLTSPAPALAFSPDGTTLARNDFGSGIYLLRVADSALIATYKGGMSSPSLVYSPDGNWLATPEPQAIALFRVSDGSRGPTRFVGRGGHKPTAVAFSSDGGMLAVGDDGGGVSLWSFPGGVLIKQFPVLSSSVSRIAFSADGQHLVVGDDYQTHVLVSSEGMPLARFPPSFSPSFAFTPDGSDVAYVSAQNPTYFNSDNPPEIVFSSSMTGAPVRAIVPANPEDLALNFNGGAITFSPTGHKLAASDLIGRIFCDDGLNPAVPVPVP